MALCSTYPVGKSVSLIPRQSFKGTHFGEERGLHRNEEHREERRMKRERYKVKGQE